MIDHLAELLTEFPGEANRTRCFTHILNLVARCIMRQFDDPNKAKGGDDIGDLADALAELDDNLEKDKESEDGIDDERAPDGREGMTDAEIEELEESVKPVRRVLTKASHRHVCHTAHNSLVHVV